MMRLVNRIRSVLREPIQRKIVLLIFIFLVALIMVSGVELSFQHVAQRNQEAINNAQAREDVSDVLLHNLLRLEMLINRLVNANEMRDVKFAGAQMQKICSVLEEGINVLRMGGQFRSVKAVNFYDKNNVEILINYHADHEGYDVDIIDLVPKLMDLQQIVTRLVKVSEERFAADDPVLAAAAIFELRLLQKQAGTYLLRSSETANKIAYDVQRDLVQMRAQQKMGGTYLIVFRFIASGVVLILVIMLGGVIIRQVGAIVDARHKAEQSLRDSERYLRTIFDTTQTGLVLIDAKDHRLLDANPSACRMLDAPKDYLMGKVCNECMCPLEDIGNCPMECGSKAVDNAERILLQRGTKRVPIIKSAVPVTIHGRKMYLESFIDISVQKMAQQKLEASYKLLEQHAIELEASRQQAVQLAEDAGRSRLDAERAQQQLKARAEELEESRRIAVEMMEGAEIARAKEEEARKQLEQNNKKLVGAIEHAKVMADKAEEANIAKSAFLANMSHEIRTPMNSILGFTEILSRKIKDPAQLKFLESIMVSGKTLLNLINDILDLSKVEAGKLTLEYTAVHPHQVFMEMKQIFSQHIERKGLGFIVEIAEDLPSGLLLDEVRLRQVLLNLIGNAVKFTDEGGVTLSVEKKNPKSDNSTIDLVFTVSDTGIGISQEQQDKIFVAFHQQEGQQYARYGGTGLGLAICWRLVELMNGEISVESREGYGSVFKVLLRDVRVAAVQEDDTDTAHEVTPDFAEADILIVDDIATNRQLLAGLLDEFPFALRMAADGQEALHAIAERKPDLVLLDIKMPVMDGNECARRIKTNPDWQDIFIVVVTASAVKTEPRAVCKNEHFDVLLHKPVSRRALLRELSRFLPLRTQTCQSSDADSETQVRVDGWPAAEDCGELIRELNDECVQLAREVADSMNVTKARGLADLVSRLAACHAAPVLTGWAERLRTQAMCFDIRNIPDTLREFETILKRLQEMSQ